MSRKSRVRQEERRCRASGQGLAPGRSGPDPRAMRRHTRRGWSPRRERDCSSPVRSGACGRPDRYGPRSQPSRDDPVGRLRWTCLGNRTCCHRKLPSLARLYQTSRRRTCTMGDSSRGKRNQQPTCSRTRQQVVHMDAVMLTINDLISKLMWESSGDILDLLEIDTLDMLKHLEEIIIDKQDKLRKYYEDSDIVSDDDSKEDDSC